MSLPNRNYRRNALLSNDGELAGICCLFIAVVNIAGGMAMRDPSRNSTSDAMIITLMLFCDLVIAGICGLGIYERCQRNQRGQPSLHLQSPLLTAGANAPVDVVGDSKQLWGPYRLPM